MRLGRYEIVERLNAGGMGEVFVARVAGPGGFLKPVALKRIHPHLATDEKFIDMLHDEANVAAAVRHPNIVTMIDVGQEGGDHYVVLDYVSGEPLSRVVRELRARGTPMPPWVVAWIGEQVASALHAAHETKSLSGESLEIVHRDVSLANIMLSDSGHAMLFDFGVAKAKQRLSETKHGELKGKLAYMAPETFGGAPVTRQLDVFGLGVVLYEMLTNVSPFQRDTDVDTIAALANANVAPPSEGRPHIDPRLDTIVMHAIARDRSDRYATAAHIERALRHWAQTSGAPHDAESVASWYAATFPDKLAARKALLARVASPSIGASPGDSSGVGDAPNRTMVMPEAATQAARSQPEPHSATMPGMSAPQQPRRPRSRGVQVAILIVAVAAAFVAVMSLRRRPAEETNIAATSASAGVETTAEAQTPEVPSAAASATAPPEPSGTPAASASTAAAKPAAPAIKPRTAPAPHPSATASGEKKPGKGPLVRSYE